METQKRSSSGKSAICREHSLPWAETKVLRTSEKITLRISRQEKPFKGGDHMAKKKPEHDKALPKADVEFAEERGNGFEKVALKSQKKVNK